MIRVPETRAMPVNEATQANEHFYAIADQLERAMRYSDSEGRRRADRFGDLISTHGILDRVVLTPLETDSED